MIPFHDENETQRTPVVTLALIAGCVLAWMGVQGAGSGMPFLESICNLGLIPGELLSTVPVGSGFEIAKGVSCVTDPGSSIVTVFTSMFMHGSWMHLIGNMWFLWLFGNNIEDSMSRPRFVVFYLVCGVAAALGQVYAEPDSIIPMVGASGAISGVMGGYLVLYPRVRIFTLVPLGIVFTTLRLPAWVMLLYWTAIQVFGGFASAYSPEGGGVAFWAHLGGFAAGVVLIKFFQRPEAVAEHRAHHYQPRRVGFDRGQWG